MLSLESINNVNRSVRYIIKFVRKKKGITQKKLANVLGVSQSYLSKIENGEASINTITLIGLLRVYCIDIDILSTNKLVNLHRYLIKKLC